MNTLDEMVRELAGVIAAQAQAIADGRVVGPVPAACKRVMTNAETLFAWSKTAMADVTTVTVDSDNKAVD